MQNNTHEEPALNRISFDQIVIEAGMFSAPTMVFHELKKIFVKLIHDQHEPEPPKPPEHKIHTKPWLYKSFLGLDRVRGLSDAVLAIVITLLVVELRGLLLNEH